MPTADQDIIKHLNTVLKNKLTGINQYFLHARMLKHMGNVGLADHEYKASIDAMKHSDMLVEHILTLGGIPGLQDLGKLMIGETPEDMLCNDLTHMETAQVEIKAAIALCESRQQAATAGLLHKILDGQQDHTNFIRTQITSGTMNLQPMKDCA